MNKIKQTLIGATALTLSANVVAIPTEINYPSFEDYSRDAIMNVINSPAGYEVPNWVVNKLDRKMRKLGVKEDKLETQELRNQQVKRLTNKIGKKKGKIAKFMAKVGLDQVVNNVGLDQVVTNDINGNGNGNGNGSVPEPSVIALLGLGLVGIGVARRMRKKTD